MCRRPRRRMIEACQRDSTRTGKASEKGGQHESNLVRGNPGRSPVAPLRRWPARQHRRRRGDRGDAGRDLPERHTGRFAACPIVQCRHPGRNRHVRFHLRRSPPCPDRRARPRRLRRLFELDRRDRASQAPRRQPLAHGRRPDDARRHPSGGVGRRTDRLPELWDADDLEFRATSAINCKGFGVTFNLPIEGGGLVVGNDVKIALSVTASTTTFMPR